MHGILIIALAGLSDGTADSSIGFFFFFLLAAAPLALLLSGGWASAAALIWLTLDGYAVWRISSAIVSKWRRHRWPIEFAGITVLAAGLFAYLILNLLIIVTFRSML